MMPQHHLPADTFPAKPTAETRANKIARRADNNGRKNRTEIFRVENAEKNYSLYLRQNE